MHKQNFGEGSRSVKSLDMTKTKTTWSFNGCFIAFTSDSYTKCKLFCKTQMQSPMHMLSIVSGMKDYVPPALISIKTQYYPGVNQE